MSSAPGRRNRACAKVGFGLVHDLRAIAAALGGEGGGAIAVVEPAADVGSIHRFLRRHGRHAGVHKARAGRGGAGACAVPCAAAAAAANCRGPA